MSGKQDAAEADFADFVASGEVETGTNADEIETTTEGKKPERRGPPKLKEEAKAPAGDDDETGGDDDETGDDDEETGEQKPKKKTAAEHQIERLKREKRDLQRQLREGGNTSALAQRLENIERGLSGGKGDDTKTAGNAPDPTDTDKYPLGHLDDRYIEDKLAWLAKSEAIKLADSALQRQQENERDVEIRTHQIQLLDKVEDLSTKGSELFEDFQEEVVEAGMRGDWKLQQATFEACHEADHGAEILYELSQDPKEALRVSRLSPYQQMKFVQERDTEISTGKKGRTKPKAGEPPKNLPRGANSSTKINPATDDLGKFAKAWEQDAKSD